MHTRLNRCTSRILMASSLGISIAMAATGAAIAQNQLEGADFNCTGVDQNGNGQGFCTFVGETVDGSPYTYYRGTVVRNVPQGRGVIVFDNNDRYEGQVKDGLPHGQGLFLFANDDRYTGNFRNGEYHGSGTLFFGGNRYSGEFRNGLFQGRGTLIYSDGSAYDGTFLQGQPHGQGTFRFGGRTYRGIFYKGQITGAGVLTNADGSQCRGQFFNSTLSGKAVCNYPANSPILRYSGELRNGIPGGVGTMVFRDGRRVSGEFRNGEYVDPTIAEQEGRAE